MLLLKKIFDKRWPIAASNWTCQSQIMYANGLNSWNCRGFSGKSMSFEKQVKSFFHAFFLFPFSGKRLFPSHLEKFFFQKKEKPANKHWEFIPVLLDSTIIKRQDTMCACQVVTARERGNESLHIISRK